MHLEKWWDLVGLGIIGLDSGEASFGHETSEKSPVLKEQPHFVVPGMPSFELVEGHEIC